MKNGAPKSDAARYAPNAAPAKPTKLGERLTNGRRGETVTVPELGVVRLELLGARAAQEVEAAVYRNMAALGIAFNTDTEARFELERAALTLSRAARDPADIAAAFGTEQEWLDLDEQIIFVAWTIYDDVRQRLDPHEDGLTDDDRALIEVAIKKKEPRLLRLSGVVKLSAYLLSTADRPLTSPPPSSSSSESPSEP